MSETPTPNPAEPSSIEKAIQTMSELRQKITPDAARVEEAKRSAEGIMRELAGLREKMSVDQVVQMSTSAREKLKAELRLLPGTAKNLPDIVAKQLVEAADSTQGFFERGWATVTTVTKNGLEAVSEALKNFKEDPIGSIMKAYDAVVDFLKEKARPYAPMLQKLGMPLPEWLQPEDPYVKAIKQELGAQNAQLTETTEDNTKVKDLISVYQGLPAAVRPPTILAFLKKVITDTLAENTGVLTSPEITMDMLISNANRTKPMPLPVTPAPAPSAGPVAPPAAPVPTA